MLEVIEEYYKKSGVIPFLVKKKLNKFEMHPDIAAEFAYWINYGEFQVNEVSVEGYTASKLAEISHFLVGEGAFILLIEFREDPKRAKQRIVDGFVLK